jgi:hypothetical protein
MLAYVFWHRAADDVPAGSYEDALRRFHARLGKGAPGGFVESACLRASSVPWLGDGGAGYEDWYVVEDFAALGVINEAAVARVNESAHDAAARLMGEGTGGVYRLLDGMPSFSGVHLASWITPAGGRSEALLEDFLADGMDREHASLWRRQMSLGPAPELCLLAGELPDGARSTRLAEGWRATVDVREAL